MTAIWNSAEHFYTFLSTDKTSASTVASVSYTGAMAFETDTNKVYFVGANEVLQPFTFPTSGGGSGSSTSSSTVNIANYPSNQVVSGSINVLNYPSVQTTGGTSGIVSSSFTGNGTAVLHAANSFVAPQGGGLTQLSNVFRTGTSSTYITDLDLTCSASGVVIAPRIHFFNGSSVTTAVDAGSWIELYTDSNSRQGYFTLAAMTSSSGSSTNSSRSTTTDTTTNSTRPMFSVSPANGSTNLYWGLESRTAFTPTASLVWNLSVHIDQN